MANATEIEPMVVTDEEVWAILRRERVKETVPPKYRGGFEGLEALTPEHAALIEEAERWVEAWEPGAVGVILSGSVGCGKTALACAMAQALIERGVKVCRWNVADLLVEIKKTWSRDTDETEDDLFDEILDASVIVLDDIGTEAPHDWVTERLYYLLDRISEAERTLVVCTNETPATLAERYGGGCMAERILSRVNGLCDPLGDWPDLDVRRVLAERRRVKK